MYDMREWLSPTVGSLKEENDIMSCQWLGGSNYMADMCVCDEMQCNAMRGYGSEKRNAAPKNANPRI